MSIIDVRLLYQTLGMIAGVKLLYCGMCGDFRAPNPNPDIWTTCRCGESKVRWIDPYAGTLSVDTSNKDKVRVLGLHNGMIRASMEKSFNSEQWREFTEYLTSEAEGYLFHKDARNCPFAFVRIGESNDTFFEDYWQARQERIRLQKERDAKQPETTEEATST